MKNSNPINSEIKDLILVAKTRRTKVFAYGFLFAFVACTAFLAFNPSNNSSSPWFDNLFSSSSANSFKASIAPYKSQVSSLFSHLFPNSSSSSLPQINATYSVAKQVNGGDRSSKDPILGSGSGQVGAMGKNQTQVQGSGVTEDKKVESGDKGSGVSEGKEVKNGSGSEKKGEEVKKDGTQEGKSQNGSGVTSKNHSSNSDKNGVGTEKDGSGSGKKGDESKEGKDQSVSGVTSKNLTSTNEIPGKGSGVSEEKPVKNDSGSDKNGAAATKDGSSEAKNQNESGSGVSGKNQSSTSKEAQGGNGSGSGKSGVGIKQDGNSEAKNQGGGGSGVSSENQTSTNETPAKGGGNSANAQKGSKASSTQNEQKSADLTSSPAKSNGSAKDSSDGSNGNKTEKWIEDMVGCDIFNGQWVKDDSYPLYPEGSCPHIDEPFDCYLNRRPDRGYQKLRWQPHGCNIPRLNATDMLERLRGKRLVFVGDSLNRNMWESLVCVLRNSVKDKKKVFDASGRHEFRTVGSYSFLFKDYKATVEFFRSPFLVQEWEMHSGNATKETLRLDIIERSSSKYKDAHLIVFNTGHWWTHEKTSKGKDYYQEGNRVYGELNVVDAFHKALNTWAKWVDANVNPKKTLVFFRGYSASHFSGGQWNSGGACDKETEPIKNEHYLSSYPTKMSVLETVIKGMKTPVNYLNITRMTDYRKDAHPSVYRKQNLTEEERKDPLRFQDCSHWCLPGVPDSWNELLYAQLIIRQYQMGL